MTPSDLPEFFLVDGLWIDTPVEESQMFTSLDQTVYFLGHLEK